MSGPHSPSRKAKLLDECLNKILTYLILIHHLQKITDTYKMKENHKNILLFFICCCLSFLITFPDTRDALLALQQPSKRTVLASIEYIFGKERYRIIKLRVGTDLSLEIYDDQQSLIQHFLLPNARDAHFNTARKLSNLFIANLDEDTLDEIIAPLVDDNLVTHFSILKYHTSSASFEHFLSSDL